MILASLIISCIVFLLIVWLVPELIAHHQIRSKFDINNDNRKEFDKKTKIEPIDPIVLISDPSVEGIYYFHRALKTNIGYNRFVVLMILTLFCTIVSLFWPTLWLLFLTGMSIQLTILSLLWLLESPVSFGTSFLETDKEFGQIKKMDFIKYMRFIWGRSLFNNERDQLTSLIFKPLLETTDISQYPEYLKCLQDVYKNRKSKFLDELNKTASLLHRRLKISFYATFLVAIFVFTSILWSVDRNYDQSVISESGFEYILYYVLTLITTIGTGDIHSLELGLLITIFFLFNIIFLFFGFLQFFGETLRFRIELAFDGYLKFINRLISETTVIRLLVLEDKLYDNWKWLNERFEYSRSAKNALDIHMMRKELDQHKQSSPGKPES